MLGRPCFPVNRTDGIKQGFQVRERDLTESRAVVGVGQLEPVLIQRRMKPAQRCKLVDRTRDAQKPWDAEVPGEPVDP